MTSTIHQTILVPTDFTEAAECAINHAMALATAFDYDLKLIHILDKDSKSKLKKEGLEEEDLEERLAERCRKITIDCGKGASYMLMEGSIFSTIGTVAEEIGAKYLVMGTHGIVGLQQKLLGAFALKVITTSPVPTIVVQKRNIEDHGYKKIIFPLDCTKESKQKINSIINIGQAFGAEIHVFSTFETDEFLSKALDRNINYVKKNLAAAKLEALFSAADEDGPEFPHQVVRYAAQVNADLITVMSMTEMSLKELILGPEAQKIINNDPQIAVMCVNPLEAYKTTGTIVY